ncbi:hypothetical protein D3C73_1109590 [compost metagenome]
MIDPVHLAVAERRVDRTFLHRKAGAIAMAVMEQLVRIVAHHVGGAPPQNAFGRRVDEGGLALGIEPVDALAYRTEDQSVLLLDALEDLGNTLPADMTQAVLPPCFRAIAPCFQHIATLDREQDPVAIDQRTRAHFHRMLAATQVNQHQIIGPRLALGQHLIAETHPQ